MAGLGPILGMHPWLHKMEREMLGNRIQHTLQDLEVRQLT